MLAADRGRGSDGRDRSLSPVLNTATEPEHRSDTSDTICYDSDSDGYSSGDEATMEGSRAYMSHRLLIIKQRLPWCHGHVEEHSRMLNIPLPFVGYSACKRRPPVSPASSETSELEVLSPAHSWDDDDQPQPQPDCDVSFQGYNLMMI